jgi:5-methylcytosine-specific restriction endonuclease McrA
MKVCSKCKKLLIISEFNRSSDAKDGLQSQCRKCNYEASKTWSETHPENVRKKNRKWWSLHPEKSKEASKKWQDANPEKYQESRDTYNKAHVQDARERAKKRREEKPGIVSIDVRNRRAKILGAGGKITNKEWQSVLDKYGHKCIYPGCNSNNVTMDHIIPLALGGEHIVENVQPLCLHHNCEKHTKIIDYRKEST